MPKLQNTYYVVQDMDRALAFYGDVLGLSLKFQDGARWAQMSAAGTNLALSSVGEAPPEARGATVVLEIENMSAMTSKIESAGGKVLSSRDMGSHGKTVTFSDTEGNILQLFERMKS
jgi:predicted enzyme related to lactoylglutathione lyase